MSRPPVFVPDQLPAGLGQAAREEEADLERLAARLSAGDLAGLPPEAEGLLAPLSPEEIDRLQSLAVQAFAGPGVPTKAITPVQASAPPGEVDRAHRRRRRFWLLAPVLPLCAAAGLVLHVGTGPTPRRLPGYEVALEGGRAATRSTPGGADAHPADEAQPLEQESHVEIVARPRTRVAADPGRLSVDAFMVTGPGDLRPAGRRPESFPGGAIRLAGRVRDLFPSVIGRARIILIVRIDEGGVPDARSLASASAADGPGWRRLEIPLQISGRVP